MPTENGECWSERPNGGGYASAARAIEQKITLVRLRLCAREKHWPSADMRERSLEIALVAGSVFCVDAAAFGARSLLADHQTPRCRRVDRRAFRSNLWARARALMIAAPRCAAS